MDVLITHCKSGATEVRLTLQPGEKLIDYLTPDPAPLSGHEIHHVYCSMVTIPQADHQRLKDQYAKDQKLIAELERRLKLFEGGYRVSLSNEEHQRLLKRSDELTAMTKACSQYETKLSNCLEAYGKLDAKNVELEQKLRETPSAGMTRIQHAEDLGKLKAKHAEDQKRIAELMAELKQSERQTAFVIKNYDLLEASTNKLRKAITAAMNPAPDTHRV